MKPHIENHCASVCCAHCENCLKAAMADGSYSWICCSAGCEVDPFTSCLDLDAFDLAMDAYAKKRYPHLAQTAA